MANETAKPVEISISFLYDDVDLGVDVFVSAGVNMYSLMKNTLMGSLMCPAICPQYTSCTANMHNVSSSPVVTGTSVQVTVVLVVVVGQLPQFDDRML